MLNVVKKTNQNDYENSQISTETTIVNGVEKSTTNYFKDNHGNYLSQTLTKD